jgi:phasin family protein
MAGKQDSTTGNAIGMGVPEHVRQAAETTLAQAKQAVDRYLHQITNFQEKVEASTNAAQAGARDINQNTLAAAEANINAALDFAQQLVRATNPQDIVTLQQSYLQQQLERMNSQIRQVGGTVTSTVADIQAGTRPSG